MVKQMVLVPELDFQRLQQWEKSVPQSSDILDSVKRPNEKELVKIYSDMENVLQDPSITEQEKCQNMWSR